MTKVIDLAKPVLLIGALVVETSIEAIKIIKVVKSSDW